MPTRGEQTTASHLFKTDVDRMADLEMAENSASLKLLMVKLYKRNPKELAKSTSDNAEIMANWVFEGEAEHAWRFKQIKQLQSTDAIYLAFDPTFEGDRVLAFVVGLHTMLLKAHGGKKEFFIPDSIHPQSLYNVARNIEIAAWKLNTSRHANGELMLLSNEINAHARNLSFEREFGKIIGRTDLFAYLLAEKSQRSITRVAQSLATAVFLPF